MVILTSVSISFTLWMRRLCLAVLLLPFVPVAQAAEPAEQAVSKEEVSAELRRAADLYSEKNYADAAQIYLKQSEASYTAQAAWALELYGVCLEKQGNHAGAEAVYRDWLEQYPESEGVLRVGQRLLAVQTAAMQPRTSSRVAGKRDSSLIYGSASLMYRGMTYEVDGYDRETTVSSLSGDGDLHFRASSGDWQWRARVTGGYLSDHSGRDRSDGRVSNLYAGVAHEPSGLELTMGRQRSTRNGIFGYFDGATLAYSPNDMLTVKLVGGSATSSSREGIDSDRLVYGLGGEYSVRDSALQIHGYFVEQTYDSLTERRAVGGGLSWFNDYSHYFLTADYDVEFSEINSLIFNGSWQAGRDTNIALSAGYQRSPFLTASNAIIGEYDVDLRDYLESLQGDTDLYDIALEKTALSQYASLVLSKRLANDHRLVAEIYHYALSDMPDFGFSDSAPDSEANTTLGLQYIWANALFENDYLSTGARYTFGDVTDTANLYVDEKFRVADRAHLVLRVRAVRRWMDELDQESSSLRPAMRLEWYVTRDLMFEAELGYEWLTQEFASRDFDSQQAFVVMGVRKGF